MAMIVYATAATSSVGCLTGCLCEVVVNYLGRPVAKEAVEAKGKGGEDLSTSPEDLCGGTSEENFAPERGAHGAGFSMDHTIVRFTSDPETPKSSKPDTPKSSQVENEDSDVGEYAQVQTNAGPECGAHTTGFSLDHTIVRLMSDPCTPESEKIENEEVRERPNGQTNTGPPTASFSLEHTIVRFTSDPNTPTSVKSHENERLKENVKVQSNTGADQGPQSTGFSIDHTYVRFSSDPATPTSDNTPRVVENEEVAQNQILEERSPSLTQLAIPNSRFHLPSPSPRTPAPAPSSPAAASSLGNGNKERDHWVSVNHKLETDLLEGLTDGSLGVSLCSGMLTALSKEDLKAGESMDDVQLFLTLSSRSITTALTSKAIFNKQQFFGISDEKWLSIERKLHAELSKGVEAGSFGVSLCANVPREDLKLEASSAAKAKPHSQFLVTLKPGSLADALNMHHVGAVDEGTLQADLSKGLDDFFGFLNWSLQALMPQEDFKVPESTSANGESTARAKMQKQLLSRLNSGWLEEAMKAHSAMNLHPLGARDEEILSVKREIRNDFSKWLEDASLGVSLRSSISRKDIKYLEAQSNMKSPAESDEWLRVKRKLQADLLTSLREGSWCISLHKAIQKDRAPRPLSIPQIFQKEETPEATPVSRINFQGMIPRKIEPTPIPIHTPPRSESPEPRQEEKGIEKSLWESPQLALQSSLHSPKDQAGENKEEGEEEKEEAEGEAAKEDVASPSQARSSAASVQSEPHSPAASLQSVHHSSVASLQSQVHSSAPSPQSQSHVSAASSQSESHGRAGALKNLPQFHSASSQSHPHHSSASSQSLPRSSVDDWLNQKPSEPTRGLLKPSQTRPVQSPNRDPAASSRTEPHSTVAPMQSEPHSSAAPLQSHSQDLQDLITKTTSKSLTAPNEPHSPENGTWQYTISKGLTGFLGSVGSSWWGSPETESTNQMKSPELEESTKDLQPDDSAEDLKPDESTEANTESSEANEDAL
eukprot:gnl/MRDRNA2_/MRDRNA2_74934_c0_seq2.p1 gnl/MRDRNA2_/MRDRNA2_74934_c0~~gnl/MRDRNA2_/MRDRNA2_74934_c0_seq2.p1  ORF type:complete len:995 (-),score=196.73 gnl/MRDRNA2_/MRDRNA2_74934_c0_seq2:12-2996(-)